VLDRMMRSFDFHASALRLRADRQSLLASNIANADTPNYKARDFDFSLALAQTESAKVLSQESAGDSEKTKATLVMARSTTEHFSREAGKGLAPAGNAHYSNEAGYRNAVQASMDGNTVDMDRERANFLDNSLRYESTLRFMNSNLRQMLSAIKGD
jgi:flagellar basal-body rod protein FlgB